MCLFPLKEGANWTDWAIDLNPYLLAFTIKSPIGHSSNNFSFYYNCYCQVLVSTFYLTLTNILSRFRIICCAKIKTEAKVSELCTEILPTICIKLLFHGQSWIEILIASLYLIHEHSYNNQVIGNTIFFNLKKWNIFFQMLMHWK